MKWYIMNNEILINSIIWTLWNVCVILPMSANYNRGVNHEVSDFFWLSPVNWVTKMWQICQKRSEFYFSSPSSNESTLNLFSKNEEVQQRDLMKVFKEANLYTIYILFIISTWFYDWIIDNVYINIFKCCLKASMLQYFKASESFEIFDEF